MNAESGRRHAYTRAVITGGTQGLGLAVARRLAHEGAATLVISGRRTALGEAAAAEISALGIRCLYVKADDCARLMAAAIGTLGSINALVSSAATTDRGNWTDTTLDIW